MAFSPFIDQLNIYAFQPFFSLHAQKIPWFFLKKRQAFFSKKGSVFKIRPKCLRTAKAQARPCSQSPALKSSNTNKILCFIYDNITEIEEEQLEAVNEDGTLNEEMTN